MPPERFEHAFIELVGWRSETDIKINQLRVLKSL